MDKFNQNIDTPQENTLNTFPKKIDDKQAKKPNTKIILLILIISLGFLSLLISLLSQTKLNIKKPSKDNNLNTSLTPTQPPQSNNPYQIKLDQIAKNLNQINPIILITIEKEFTF